MSSLTASFSIWAMPKGPLANQLQRVSASTSSRLNAPTFLPHVTIIGGVELEEQNVIAVAQELASKIKKYKITLDKVSYGSIFHQCIYILCRPTPDTLQAATTAKQLLNIDPSSSPYMPHLSLLYADIPMEQREQLAEQLQGLLFGGGGEVLREQEFEVDSITVWFTPPEDKSLESWILVKEIPLGS